MCQKNDLPLSLKSDTFNALCSDFDQILRSMAEPIKLHALSAIMILL